MPSHTPPTQTYHDSNSRDSTSHTRSCDVIALMGAKMGVVGAHATVATSESLLLSSMLTCERVRTNERQRMQPRVRASEMRESLRGFSSLHFKCRLHTPLLEHYVSICCPTCSQVLIKKNLRTGRTTDAGLVLSTCSYLFSSCPTCSQEEKLPDEDLRTGRTTFILPRQNKQTHS